MKLNNISNIDEFLNVIKNCKGTVELISKEGDRLNMKSKLTQYVAMAKIFSGDFINEVELVVYDPEDVNKFLKYMLNRNK